MDLEKRAILRLIKTIRFSHSGDGDVYSDGWCQARALPTGVLGYAWAGPTHSIFIGIYGWS